MSGLVGYATSDSESEEPSTTAQPIQIRTQKPVSQGSPKLRPQPTKSQVERPLEKPFKPSTYAQDAASTQSALHNLTLPTVPNLDIPPSPPGSPNAITTAKITQFLALKQQGVHFNAKLAGSASLRNPALLGKLIEVAGLDREEMYASSLPRELWDPLALRMEARSKEKSKKGVEFVKGRE